MFDLIILTSILTPILKMRAWKVSESFLKIKSLISSLAINRDL